MGAILNFLSALFEVRPTRRDQDRLLFTFSIRSYHLEPHDKKTDPSATLRTCAKGEV